MSQDVGIDPSLVQEEGEIGLSQSGLVSFSVHSNVDAHASPEWVKELPFPEREGCGICLGYVHQLPGDGGCAYDVVLGTPIDDGPVQNPQRDGALLAKKREKYGACDIRGVLSLKVSNEGTLSGSKLHTIHLKHRVAFCCRCSDRATLTRGPNDASGNLLVPHLETG